MVALDITTSDQLESNSTKPKKRPRTENIKSNSTTTLKKIYKCTFEGCAKSYRKPSKLQEHERTHTGERPFVCTFAGCGKSYMRSTHLAAHARRHDPDASTAFKCSFTGCSKAFATQQHLQRHEALHTAPTPHKCEWPGCGASFSKRYQLRNHMCFHTGKKPYPCTIEGCSKSFDTACKLEKHEMTHSDDLRYVCGFAECTARFSRWTELRHHVSHDHPVNCEICGKSFAKQAQLKRHFKSKHVDHDPISCYWEGCSKTFFSKKALKMHIELVHERPSRYKCTFEGCGKGFPYKSLLERHEQSHSKPRASSKGQRGLERSIADMITGYDYAEKSSRRRWACPFKNCNHKFTREYDLERHLQSKMHEDDLEYALSERLSKKQRLNSPSPTTPDTN